MNKGICCFLFSFFIAHTLKSQIFPKEGARLNYRIVGFSFAPVAKDREDNLLEIALGNFNNDDSFRHSVILTINGSAGRTIAEVPYFGAQYTWRLAKKRDRNVKEKYRLHHFGVLSAPELDTNSARLRISANAKKYKDAYVFLDCNRALYDMNGNLVWFLPIKSGDGNQKPTIRDMKMTSQGTITYVIDDKGIFEVNYDGDTLWKRINDVAEVIGDSIGKCHHEFTRLSNGHYMALCQNFPLWKNQEAGDTNLVYIQPKDIIAGKEYKGYNRTPMATLAEYDAKGKMVWSWKLSDYMNGSGFYYRPGSGQMTAHENSFFFDEKSKALYVSARNLNRIIKLKYPSGSILSVFGDNNDVPGNTTAVGTDMFCGQHSCRISEKGYLYLYNNNTCQSGGMPSVLMFREAPEKKGGLEKIWAYDCETEAGSQKGFPSGGNVLELPDHSIFVSNAFPDSKVFIVNMNKEILWSAAAEKWDVAEKKWEPVNIFRASILTSRKDLERLIWSGQRR